MEPNELPEELQSIRHLHTYTAPSGYFDGLADDVISKVHLPVAAGMPFSQPPVSYFDTLADSVLSKIKGASFQSDVQKELEEIEPLLASIPRTNVYRVPDGYFDSFAVAIPAPQKSASVIQMRRPSSWLRYASAAVIAGVIATGAVLYINKDKADDTSSYTQALAKVSDNDLVNYLDNSSPDEDIETPADDDNIGSSEGLYKSLLESVSDNEIQDYLNENDDSDEKNIKGI